MERRTALKIIAFTSVTPTLVNFSSTARAASRWDLPMQWPPENFYALSAARFAERVKEVTDGEVLVTIHYSSSLGFNGSEMLAAIREGLVPIGDVTQRLQVGEEPFLGIEGLPYLASSFDELRTLLGFTRPIHDEIARKHNQKILYIQPWPGQQIFATDPIASVADMATLTMRTVDANGTEFMSRLGANPVQLPWGEVMPSLASGAINAVTTSNSSAVDGKFWEFIGYSYAINWQIPISSINVNLDAWGELPEVTRAAIEAEAKRLEPEFWQVTIDEDSKKLKVLTDNGIQVAGPDDLATKEIIAVAEQMWSDFAERVPEAKSVIEKYREVVSK